MPGTAKSSRAPSSAAENLLWFFLRDGQVGDFQFHRRIVIGRAVADFVCFETGLAIEIEVGPPWEERPEERPQRGALEAYGFRVLRFAAHDVLLGTESVLEAILEALLTPRQADDRRRPTYRGADAPRHEPGRSEHAPSVLFRR